MAMTNDEIAKWLASITEAIVRIEKAVSLPAAARPASTLTLGQQRRVDREELRKANESFEKYCRDTDFDIG